MYIYIYIIDMCDSVVSVLYGSNMARTGNVDAENELCCSKISWLACEQVEQETTLRRRSQQAISGTNWKKSSPTQNGPNGSAVLSQGRKVDTHDGNDALITGPSLNSKWALENVGALVDRHHRLPFGCHPKNVSFWWGGARESH